MVLIVTYDLHNPGRDYDAVADALRSASGGWAHPQGSVWFIDTLESAARWRDRFVSIGDANDEYFVAQLTREWASQNMDSECARWLKDSRRRW